MKRRPSARRAAAAAPPAAAARVHCRSKRKRRRARGGRDSKCRDALAVLCGVRDIWGGRVSMQTSQHCACHTTKQRTCSQWEAPTPLFRSAARCGSAGRPIGHASASALPPCARSRRSTRRRQGWPRRRSRSAAHRLFRATRRSPTPRPAPPPPLPLPPPCCRSGRPQRANLLIAPPSRTPVHRPQAGAPSRRRC